MEPDDMDDEEDDGSDDDGEGLDVGGGFKQDQWLLILDDISNSSPTQSSLIADNIQATVNIQQK